jgi:hypothetical protein
MTDNNTLTGPIPSEIGNISELENLYLCEWASINRVEKRVFLSDFLILFLNLLDSSRMTDKNALTGLIPSEIGNLWPLQVLSLCE